MTDRYYASEHQPFSQSSPSSQPTQPPRRPMLKRHSQLLQFALACSLTMWVSGAKAQEVGLPKQVSSFLEICPRLDASKAAAGPAEFAQLGYCYGVAEGSISSGIDAMVPMALDHQKMGNKGPTQCLEEFDHSLKAQRIIDVAVDLLNERPANLDKAISLGYILSATTQNRLRQRCFPQK